MRQCLTTRQTEATQNGYRRNGGVDVAIGGIIASIRQLKTRKGDRMAVIMLEDAHGSVEVVVFPEAYGKCASVLDTGAMVVVKGRVEVDEETIRMTANEVMPHRDDAAEDVARAVDQAHVAAAWQADIRGAGGSLLRATAAIGASCSSWSCAISSRPSACVCRWPRRCACVRPSSWHLRSSASAAQGLLYCDDRRKIHHRDAEMHKRQLCCGKNSLCALCSQWLQRMMPTETLEFEESLAPLLKEVDALSALPRTEARERELERLNHRLRVARTEIYSKLTPWQRVLVARHPSRPDMLDYVDRLFTDFVELHGDRRFADDHAIVAGTACYKGEPVMVVGHHKGGDTKQKIYRNFGYARPEGYRKAIRLMRTAEKFQRPIIVFVDTPAAYPGVESEERGVAEAIAFNLREMSVLKVPIVVIITGEGGSGGALGIAIGDRILMQEYAIYSVIPPEGCAAILWRDAGKKVEAATALKLTAPDLLARGIIDEIVREPIGGAHTSLDEAATLLDGPLRMALEAASTPDIEARLARRYEKFRDMGRQGADFTDEESS